MQNLFKGMKPKIVVCSPMPLVDGKLENKLENITVEWHRHRQNLIPPFGKNYREIAIDGYPIDEARCAVAQMAIDCESEFLFFNDYDVLLPENILNKLVFWAGNKPYIDVFSGVYCAKMEPPVPLIYKSGQVFWDWCIGDILIDDIDGCGMGCCLIRTELFKKLIKSNPDKPLFRTSENGSEDIYFLRRAKDELNNKILIDTSFICGHIDNNTGKIYGLPEECIPMQKYLNKGAK